MVILMNTNETVPAHTYPGSIPVTGVRATFMEDVEPAEGSYGAYEDPRAGRCEGNEETCGAYPLRGDYLCKGHRKQADNLAKIAILLESES